MEVRKGEPIKNGSEIIGNKVKVKIAKNKVSPPFKTCEVDLIYGVGIDADAEIVEMAAKYDVIHKAGSWFSYGEEKIGQGSETVKAWLDANPDKKAEIIQKIKDLKTTKEGAE